MCVWERVASDPLSFVVLHKCHSRSIWICIEVMIIATQKCAVLVVVGMNKTCTFGAELMVDDLAFFRM